jgi:hypothetical protein
MRFAGRCAGATIVAPISLRGLADFAVWYTPGLIRNARESTESLMREGLIPAPPAEG